MKNLVPLNICQSKLNHVSIKVLLTIMVNDNRTNSKTISLGTSEKRIEFADIELIEGVQGLHCKHCIQIGFFYLIILTL